jgi:hypothetical protein
MQLGAPASTAELRLVSTTNSSNFMERHTLTALNWSIKFGMDDL